MSKIKVENVSFVYSAGTPFEVKALDDVTIEIKENTITGIIGHTGSGKSTLVQMFNGLVKPMSGRILLDGEDIWEKPKSIGSVRYRVGLVMQYPEYQLFEDTVIEDISFGPKNMGLDPDEIKKRVLEACELVGLDFDMLSKSPFDLSGGQKRRAAIAGVMAMRPEVLVLDEPAAGLDPAGRNSIFDGIKRYADATGAAVIIVSHSMDDMAKYCDELVVLSHSKVAMFGNRKEVFSRSRELEAIGLGVPQITRLVMLLRDKGIEISPDIYTVDEAETALAALFGGGV
ncbi:MAG: energy-coupling factor transporter ATPase [Clostridia bacterium]|nr:energy-coupling factor transporter ATPase [Clostridia bacterium]